MKGKIIILLTLFIFSCQTDRRIIEEETFYEAIVNGEFVRNSNVTYKYFGPESKLVINCRQYSDEGFLRRNILFGSISPFLNSKEPLYFDQWGGNDHSDAVVNLTTW